MREDEGVAEMRFPARGLGFSVPWVCDEMS